MPRNLRILKKLSKRAAPLLVQLGIADESALFRAEKNDNYHGTVIRDRKHWERTRCHPSHKPVRKADEIKYLTRKGHVVSMSPPSHPLKGTMMTGGMSGYYEPEWSEECAYAALFQHLSYSFAEYDEKTEDLVPTRLLSSPSDVFAAASELVARGHGA